MFRTLVSGEKGGDLNGSPGFFRLWIGRLFWGGVVMLPLAVLFFVLLMVEAERRGLDHSRTVLESAESLLSSAMISGNPETVPQAISRLSTATGAVIVLLRNDGSSAYSDQKALDHIKAYTAVPDAWRNTLHSPDVFPWPSTAVPERLAHEVDRIFAEKNGHLVADLHGMASPIALHGGYAVWSRAIHNHTACARCHGFDSEVLGHWVVISRVVPVSAHAGRILWGFWPLPQINQTIIFGGTAGLVVFSLLFVSAIESFFLKRALRPKAPKKKAAGKSSGEKGAGAVVHEAALPAPGSDEPDLTVSYEGWQELHTRLETLDHSIVALAEEIPRPGILPTDHKESGEVVEVHVSLSEMLADWSDRFEMALQELESHPLAKSDAILLRFIEKAREFRAQAVSYVDVANSEKEPDSFGVLKAPFFEVLSEEHKEWTDRLRAVLGHLHAEIRAMEGVTKTGIKRTEPPREQTEKERDPANALSKGKS